MPRIAACGGFRIGVLIIEPKMPPLVIVNVPPSRSVNAILPSRAFFASSPIFFSMSAKLELVRVAEDRHHQPLLGADGDADVVEVLVDDVVAVDARVDERERLAAPRPRPSRRTT